MAPCLQKDPGEAEGGGFTGGNGEPMVANDIYASWKKGNDRLSINGSLTNLGTLAVVCFLIHNISIYCIYFYNNVCVYVYKIIIINNICIKLN